MCTRQSQTSNVRAKLAPQRYRITFIITDDQAGMFNLADSSVAGVSEGRIELLWRHPKQPLTLVIVTPYTEKREAFVVDMDFPDEGTMSKIYQIIDGEEKEISFDDDFMSMKSDSDYRVIVKFIPIPEKKDEVKFGYVFERI